MNNKFISSLVLLSLVLLLNFSTWMWLNRPATPTDWNRHMIRGLSFSPYQKNQDPQRGQFPSRNEIDKDLAQLAGKVRNIRSYSSLDGLEQIPELAAKHGLTVTAGAWLDRRNERNQQELDALIRNARRNGAIERLIVGNETLLRDDMGIQELIGYLRRVRQETHLPVSTAEPWHVWLEHPELTRAVDFIAVHLLPYWEGVPADEALIHVVRRYRELHQAYPDKPILIAEVGWPSAGNRILMADASRTRQATFIRNFLNLAEQERWDYFLMEAYDQPWKIGLEGLAGGYWGMFDADRNPKYPLSGPVYEYPTWETQAVISILLGSLPLLWFPARCWRNIRVPGRILFSILIQGAVSLFTWSAFLPENIPLNIWAWLAWMILLPAQILLLLVMLVNGFELTELLWHARLKWRAPRPASKDAANLPLVSLHLAICNEPPAVVKHTLNSLAALEYPRLEVLVIDNNTRDPAIWKPVQAHCERLGSRFRFFTLGKWPGYKAGALNFALRETNPEATIIGVVDSDYQVRADWLRRLIPYFQRARVGFVQAPQDNREWENDRFKTMINWEYAGFFHIGMIHRDQRNAIIQHGTMTLIRRSALQKLGGWSEWCICEDAELGLRLMKSGYESIYVDEPLGHGLTPESFTGYRRQRFRWVYGAVQILKAHWKSLLPWSQDGLTPAQRYHFVAGWLPWFGDALHLIFTYLALIWTAGLLIWPQYFGFPFAIFLLPTIWMFLFKMAHSWFLYQAKVPCTIWQRLGAGVAGMALTHVIALGVIKGLITNGTPFLRTPKAENKPALLQGILMASEELFLLCLLWTSAIATVAVFGINHPEANLWMGLLLVQSTPYIAAFALAMTNAFPTFDPTFNPIPVPVVENIETETSLNNLTA